jgi:hypothetical protein
VIYTYLYSQHLGCYSGTGTQSVVRISRIIKTSKTIRFSSFLRKKTVSLHQVQGGYTVFENKHFLIAGSAKTVLDGVNNIDDSIDFSAYTDSTIESAF